VIQVWQDKKKHNDLGNKAKKQIMMGKEYLGVKPVSSVDMLQRG